MSDVTEWTHIGRSIDNEGAPIDGFDDERAAAILFIGSPTEPDSGAAMFASEARFPGLPSVAQMTGPRSNGENVRNIHPPCHTRMIDGAVRSDTSYAVRQTPLRVQELTIANRRKDEFLAMLGHELRNPLASIHNGVHLLTLQTRGTPASQKIQAMIERQIRRMTQLLDDLLDVSRITQGRLRLQCERIDLRDVVSRAIETLEPDVKQRNHRLTTALPDAPVWLQADPGRLEQVFVNLLANASKYTDAGGELAVWMHVRKGQAIVRVRDSGIGIASEALPHLFDLFRQADEAAPRSQSGLGIGLALVRNIVESHGGSVTGASAGLGRGSEFAVRLPRET
jgi:signal transduction histidine kinase